MEVAAAFCHWHLGCYSSGNYHGSRFSRQDWIHGQCCIGRHRLGDYPHLKSSFYWCLGSLLLGLFGSEGLSGWGVSARWRSIGAWWVTMFALQFQMHFHLSDQRWIGMEFCTPGVTGYDLDCPVSPECVDPSHCFYFHFNIHCFHGQKVPDVAMQRSCILVLEHRPSRKLAILSFIVFVMLFIQSLVCLFLKCLSMMGKSRGSFFIKHLILILSWNLIVTTLPSSLFPKYPKCNFYLI